VVAALCCAAALRLFFYSGLTGYDEFAYARIAADIAEGLFRLPDVSGYYGFRYLVTFPAAFFYKLLGQGALSSAAWPFLCSLGNTALAYFLGRELFGRRAGVISAFMQAFLPVSVVYGTMLYPDEVLVLWTGLSALLFLKGSKSGGRWGGAGLFALSGLLAGLGWHTRLNSAIMLPVFAVWLIRLGPRPAHLALVCGFAAALAPDWAAGAIATGDPLFSMHSQLAKLSADAAVYSSGHAVYIRGLMGLDLYGLGLFGIYFYLFAAAAAVYAYSKRLKEIWLPLVWFAVVFAYLEFGPAALDPYRPVHKQLRFFSMAMFPVIFVAAAYVAGQGRSASRSIMVLALSASVIGAAKMSAYQRRGAAPLREAAERLEKVSPSAIYADGAWGNYLGYRFRHMHREPYYMQGESGFMLPLRELPGGGGPHGACALIEAGTPLAVKGSSIVRVSGGAEIHCYI